MDNVQVVGHDPRRKIRDVNEFVDWYERGFSYRQMSELHFEKYGERVSPTMFSNWRIKLGLKPRLASRDKDVIPWEVDPRHSTLLPMRMLHIENRRRKRLPVTAEQLGRFESWKELLAERDLVVHYEPDTERGFFLVPRREGVDKGLIREPDEK